MNKVDYLRQLTESTRLFYDDAEVLYPLILALSPEEAVAFFDLSFEQHYQVRQWLAKKICIDIQLSMLNVHLELIRDLAAMVNLKGFPKRETCGYALMTLIAYAEFNLQQHVIGILLSSNYRVVRERAYKRLFDHWDNWYCKQIEANWAEFGDKKCMRLIVKHFPKYYLADNFTTLKESLSSFDLTSIFVKHPVEFRDQWSVLKEIDEVSYVYILTKAGEVLTIEEANAFLATNYLNDRVGLLLWCFGRMGLWDALVNFNDHYREKIREHKIRGM
jgi:hypothetical protein